MTSLIMNISRQLRCSPSPNMALFHVPVFDFGNHAKHLKALEAYFKNTAKVERLLTVWDRLLLITKPHTSKYIHTVPYVRPSFDAQEHDDKDLLKCSAHDADLEQTALSKSARI